MKSTRIEELFELYRQDTISEDQLAEMRELMILPENEELSRSFLLTAYELPKELQDVNADSAKAILGAIYLADDSSVSHPVVPVREKVRFWPKIAIAAAVATIIFGAGLFYFSSSNKKSDETAKYVNDIAPGKIGATLTLANGKKIKLSDVVNGEIAKEAGVTITKTADGKLVYEIKETGGESNLMNTLSTARGEMYDVTLPDGSMVTLNAASSLKYPSNFNSSATRNVELTGEGYFQVAKDKLHPFVVESKGQRVEVLGTHFNINAYEDESAVITALLEGSVKINDRTVLKPNQQSVVSGRNVQVQSIDAEDAVAWKNGLFVFDDEPLENVMRKISRWYNVEIEYATGVDRKRLFGGSVSRFDKASTVLEMLESTKNIHFKVEGGRILVMK